jgi:4a-hydroxytetrahydrobiopterin dehydratase
MEKEIGNLTQKICKACEGYEKPMNLVESEKYLEKINDWKIIDNGKMISKIYEFKNFKGAINFINMVGEIAEKEGHHPDIYLHNYKKVRIDLTTHAIKGLSENDFIEAAKIDKFLK